MNTSVRFSALFYLLLFYGSTNLYAQPEPGILSPTLGLTFRTTATGFLNFNGVLPWDWRQPYDYEQNVQGLRVNAGLEYQATNKIALAYYANVGYDRIASYRNPDPSTGIFYGFGARGDSLIHYPDIKVEELILDHNIQLILRGKKIDYGIGLSIINSGKGYEYYEDGDLRYHNIQFTAYNLFLQFPILKKINTEIKAQYVPAGFPQNPFRDVIMMSIRTFYRFDPRK